MAGLMAMTVGSRAPYPEFTRHDRRIHGRADVAGAPAAWRSGVAMPVAAGTIRTDSGATAERQP